MSDLSIPIIKHLIIQLPATAIVCTGLALPAFAVTDAEIEALEKQLQLQEEELKQKQEELSRKKLEKEQRARSEAERKAKEAQVREQELQQQAEQERMRKEEEQRRLQAEEQRRIDETRRAEEERQRQEEAARIAEEERIRQEVERRLAEEDKKRQEKAEAEKKRLAIEAINNLCSQIVGTWKWNDINGTVSRFYQDGKIVSINLTQSHGTWECVDAQNRAFIYTAWNVQRKINLNEDNKGFKSTGQSGEPIVATKISDDPEHNTNSEQELIKRYLAPLG
ncbi:MAG: hypothetical protein MI673_00610 [Thiotrichales bacterium]|nr:hypothetical protein [Thiotrichales bacterium]